MAIKSSGTRRPLTGPRPAVVVKRHPQLEAPPGPPAKGKLKRRTARKHKRARRAR